MTGDSGGPDDDHDHAASCDEGESAGEGIPEQELLYWDGRRALQELDDDEAGQREGRRLRAQGRKTHFQFRMRER